jgi:hypothetical protein
LRVELLPYNEPQLGPGAPQQQKLYFEDACRTFTTAVWDLLCVLHRWQLEPEKDRSEGLTLELSFHSPSDSRYYYKELQIREADTAWSLVPRNERYRDFLANNRGHGWVDGRCSERLMMRYYWWVSCSYWGPIFDPYGSLKLSGQLIPEVPLVTTLVIRRQFYHVFSDQNLSALRAFLPNLAEFRYEHTFPDGLVQPNWVKAMASGSQGLKSLSVFQIAITWRDGCSPIRPLDASARAC